MGSAVKSVERLDRRPLEGDCHCSIIIILGDEGGIAFIGDT